MDESVASVTTTDLGNELRVAKAKPATRASKRRTKTGCITCRRRRIKCGEERPSCGNCAKSRRPCEGYDKVGSGGLPDPGIGHPRHLDAHHEALHGTEASPFSLPGQSIGGPATIPYNFSDGETAQYAPQAFGYNVHPPPLDHPPPAFTTDAPLHAIYSNDHPGSLPGHPINRTSAGLLGRSSSLGYPSATVDEHSKFAYVGHDPHALVRADKHGRATAIYTPRPTDMPFADPHRRHLLRHYLRFTAPMLSIFERDLPDSEAMFLERSDHSPRKNFWTFFVPSIAMLSPPLAYAICAVASLQYEKQTGQMTGKSSEYYHEAITRLSNAIGLANRRSEVSLLIATLLLGYYEVMSAEHKSWNSHVLGSKQLISEIRFGDMRERIRLLDLQNRQTKSPEVYARDVPLSHKYYWDEELLGTLMGRPVNNNIEDDVMLARSQPELTDGDLRKFEAQQNLFWWFTKQDIYRSVLSGLPLLHPYASIGTCPPRSAFNDAERPCGTADHLFLLLSRIADFCSRDRKRKLAPERANSGAAARSNPGSFAQNPGSHPPMQSPAPGPSPMGAPPVMYGLVPPPPPPKMPPGYIQHHLPSPASSVAGGDYNLDLAINDWTSLFETMILFQDILGEDFRPITVAEPQSTPFGPAIMYKSSPIAVIWALYYMGMIILHRNHPSMPPIATQALGAAAAQTAEYADLIGRIAAGVSSSAVESDRGVLYMASLIELSICIFFSGVQWMDPGRRTWTVTMMKHIHKVCGWETALAIGAGCEIFWEGAAQMGGPPYTRVIVENPKSGSPATSSPDQTNPVEHLEDLPAKSPVKDTYIVDQANGNRRYAMGVLEGLDDLNIADPSPHSRRGS